MSVRRPARIVAAAGAALMLAACSGGALPTATPQPPTPAPTPVVTPAPAATQAPAASVAAATSAPTPAPTPTPSPTPVAVTLDASVWWAGYSIHVTGAQYDPTPGASGTLTFDSTWTNTGTGQNDTGYVGDLVTLASGGQFISSDVRGGAVPAGATVRTPIVFTVPDGFTPDGAVLTFGQPDQHQALIPLVGGSVQSEQPVQIAVTGKMKIGPFVTFTVTGGQLLPASCGGSNEKLTYGAAKKTDMAIVLTGSATNQDPSLDALIDSGFVLVPDGTTGASTPGVSVYMASKATVRGETLCFDVPAPGTGAYTVTLHETRAGKSASLKFTVGG